MKTCILGHDYLETYAFICISVIYNDDNLESSCSGDACMVCVIPDKWQPLYNQIESNWLLDLMVYREPSVFSGHCVL